MKGDGFDQRAVTGTDRQNLTAPAGEPRSTPHPAKERRKYIEDVDDLDLYMKIYPEVKRRRDEAERQVKLVEAEMKRREDLKFFSAQTTSSCARMSLKLRLWTRSLVLRIQHARWRQEVGGINIDYPAARHNLSKFDD